MFNFRLAGGRVERGSEQFNLLIKEMVLIKLTSLFMMSRN